MRLRRAAAVRRVAGALFAFTIVGALVGGLTLPAAATISTGVTASDLAAAIDAQDPTVVTGADLTRPPGAPDAVSDTRLASFPTDRTSYDILTTGNANLADDPNSSGSSGANDNGTALHGTTAFDVSILQVNIDVPSGSNCLRVDFRFLSEEFPEYVGTTFNDGFVAELDSSTWTANNSSISAPNNFAFDPHHDVISINSSGFTHMTAIEAAGTTYDGATPLLVAQTPITSGDHTVYFSIFDQGDRIYDSAAFLDNLSLGTQTGDSCVKGAQPLSNVSLSVDKSSVPAGFGSMPIAGMNYGALTENGSDGATSLATAPITHGPITHGPITHGPITHGPITHGPITHGAIVDADVAFRFAPLSSLPLADSPPILLASVPYAGGSWSSVLPASLAALPLQTVTLQQFAATPAAADVSVADVDLRNTPLGGMSPAALLLSNVTAGQLGLSGPGIDTSKSLAAVELGGQPLASLAIPAIMPATEAPVLSSSLLGAMQLSAIDFAQTPEWNVQIGSLTSTTGILDCASCPGPTATLEAARQAGALDPNATVNALLSRLPSGFTGTFGQLLPGIIGVLNFPFNRTPLTQILDAAALSPAGFVTYTAAADLGCPMASGANTATMAVTLPGHGFRYVPGNATLTLGTGSPNPIGDPSIIGNRLTWSVNDAACTSGSEHVALTFDVEPGPELGTFSSSLVVTTAGGITNSVLDQAPVTTTENFEPNTAAAPQPIATNTLYTDTISTGSDADYFVVPVDQSDVGRMVRVSLFHQPGDYDIVMYGAAASATLRGAPITHGPITHGPITHGPLGDDGECLPPGTVLQPQALQDVPILNSDTHSVRGYSTNRGANDEFACTVVQPADVTAGGILIQVTGYNNSSSPHPAVLSAMEGAETQQLPCLGVPTGSGSSGPALPGAGTLPVDTQTLFLVNEAAIGKWYGSSGESQVDAALSDPAFLGMPNVKGVVLSVDRDPTVTAAYDSWYQASNYCSPEKANDVVRAINGLVDSYRTGSGLPNLKNIVLIGSDAVMPFGRVQEQVSLGGENTEAADVQFDNKDNPTSRALAIGYFLSDDPYYSFQPIPWLSNDLYPPSVAGGRLVETPADVVRAIGQYKSFNGSLNPTTAFVSGYDFFKDTAQQQDAALHGLYAYPKVGGTTYLSQINESWTATNLANAVNAKPGIAVLNAHADNYRLEPAAAFHSPTPIGATDLYSTSDLVSSTLAHGTLAFSIGCHAGLSVPDVWVTATDPATLDWAQAFSDKNSLFDGNTGFGYGDDTTIAYSEKLDLLLTKNLDGSMSVGQAVAFAKQQYYAGLGSFGVFDSKSVEQFTPYGLPMYVIGPGGQVAGPVPPTSPPSVSYDSATELNAATLHFATLNSGAVDTGNGVYYKGPNGDTQAEQYRPIEPVTAPQDMTQPEGSGLRLHGALMLSFDQQVLSPFKAAISVPTLAPGSEQPSPNLMDATFPGAFVNTFVQDTVFGPRDSMVVFGGQFVSDPTADPNIGNQRLLSNADVRAYYSPSSDYSVVQFDSINATLDGIGNTDFQVKTAASGQSDDAASIYVTYRPAGSNHFQSAKMTLASGLWTLHLPVDNVVEYFVQAVSHSGTVSASTFKALMFPKPTPPPPSATTPVVTVTDQLGNPVSSSETGGWYRKSPLHVSVTSGTESFALTVGGSAVSNPATVSGDGDHEVDYTGDRGTVGNVEVPIDTTNPTLSSCLPSPGTYFLNAGTPPGSVPVSVDVLTGGSPSGIDPAASTLNAILDTSTVGTKTLTFSAVDYAGNSASKTCTYSVQYKFTGFSAPVNNPPTVNAAKAGQAIPIKWTIRDATGAGVSDPNSFVDVTVAPLSNANCSGVSDAIETYTASSGIRYLGNGNWQFDWATPKKYATQCKTLSLELRDGPTLTAGGPRTAYFQFK